MSQFLGCFPEEDILHLLRRGAAALSEGGSLYTLDTAWDRQRSPAAACQARATSRCARSAIIAARFCAPDQADWWKRHTAALRLNVSSPVMENRLLPSSSQFPLNGSICVDQSEPEGVAVRLPTKLPLT